MATLHLAVPNCSESPTRIFSYNQTRTVEATGHHTDSIHSLYSVLRRCKKSIRYLMAIVVFFKIFKYPDHWIQWKSNSYSTIWYLYSLINNDEHFPISRGPVSLTQNYPGRSIASKRQAREASFRLPLLPY